jgi:pilus assembly protein CpaB
MNRNRIIIGLVVAIIVALATSYFVYQQLRRSTEVTAQPVSMGTVVVAAADLPVGSRLQPQLLREIPWPEDEPVPGMFSKVEECTDRALINSVVTNEPILENKLAPKEAGAGLAATIPEGKRGLSVRVDEVVGVAGFVLPFTMVDVLVTGSTGSDSVTRVILENIRVLTSGQRIEEDKDGKPQKVSVVTLEVTPQEANKLAMASTEGRIQLALRNTIDTEKVEPASVYRSELFGGRRRLIRRQPGVQPKAQAYVVEVIRGNKRESKAFENE